MNLSSTRFALCQMDVRPGEPQKNFNTISRMVDDARDVGADVIVFPEMCVGGYLLGDKWCQDSVCEELASYNERIKELSDGCTIVWGNVHVAPHRVNKDGRVRKYNAAFVAHHGGWAPRDHITDRLLPMGMQPKVHLPNYRFFDDERYFLSLKDEADDLGVGVDYLIAPFDVGGLKLGVLVCEDIWCEDYRKDGRSLNPAVFLSRQGTDVICSISASPWTFGKNDARDRRVRKLLTDGRIFFPGDHGADKRPSLVYVNNVGVQNNGKNIITFDGGTSVYDRDGKLLTYVGEQYKETILFFEGDDFNRCLPIKRRESSKIEQKYDAIVAGLTGLRSSTGELPRYVIGLSGGIDSAVVAALIVSAFGPDSVVGVNMPTRFNSERTKGAAAQLARNLGIRYIEVPIGGIADNYDVVMANALEALQEDKERLTSLVKENIQAKVRATGILSSLAACLGRHFTNNGNKLEVALGYATLYGDWGGAVCVIGDLTKAEVYDMARYINREVMTDVIPSEMIPTEDFDFSGCIQPSAELKDAQVDPMKFGYHDAVLDAVTDYRKRSIEDLLQWFLDGELHTRLGIDVALLKRWGVTDGNAFADDIIWFFQKLDGAVFKRVQSPPVIVTSKSAFGFDIRESILPFHLSQRELELLEKIRLVKEYVPT